MRLVNVSLHGFSRFREASCNVDGRVIAFIGPNEAGKSSLLYALRWLTDANSEALPSHLLNRSRKPGLDENVVSAKFILDATDLDLIRGLDIDPIYDLSSLQRMTVVLAKSANGQRHIEIEPRLPRNPQPFSQARKLLLYARDAVTREWELYADELAEEIDVIEPSLDISEPGYLELGVLRDGAARIDDILTRMADEEGGFDNSSFAALKEAYLALVTAIDAGSKAEPDALVRSTVEPLIPRFVLYEEADREVPASFDVTADIAVPNALRNLLQLGGATVEDVRESLDGISGYRSLEKKINRSLEKFDSYWSQSDMRPHVGLSRNGVIDTTIDDAEGYIAISERSEGLRAFLALSCFLLTTAEAVPPILLIDEAERNLHYDAQGDLVRLLTNELPVGQVIYTTHSPGCLPLDLGNGIRVVARAKHDSTESVLLANFWTDEEPGFSRLLFAMGAKAAAFSALNKAILAEGPSEMILLPALLRKANPKKTIDFQVAFGLPNMSLSQDIGDVAIRTAYLADGDKSGDAMLAVLEKAGVPAENRLQLPRGFAIEDLLDRSFYLDAVDDVIRDSGRTVLVDRNRLDPRATIAKAVDLLEKDVPGFRAPGHKLVASRIAQNAESMHLSPDGLAFLAEELWPQIEKAFKKSYTISA